MAELTCKTEFVNELKDKTLVLDTCVLVELGRCPELLDLFIELRDNGCMFVTTVDVYSEFMQNAIKWQEVEDRKKILSDLRVGCLPDMGMLTIGEGVERFQVALNNVKAVEKVARNQIMVKNAADCKPSIVDARLLFFITGRYDGKQLWLLTSNCSDVPLAWYENRGTIAINDRAGVRTISAYEAKMNEIARALAKVTDDGRRMAG